MKRIVTIAATLALASTALGQTIELAPLNKGATRKLGGYRPQRVTLAAEKPATVTKVPEAAELRFATLKLGPQEAPLNFVMALSEPAEGPAKLFVDANANGDLTDDPAVEWKPVAYQIQSGESFNRHTGTTALKIPFQDGPFDATISMYRFDPKDPGRTALKDVILYYNDYAVEGKGAIGGETYDILLNDAMARGDFRGTPIDKRPAQGGADAFLLVDVNKNGRFDSRGESFDVRAPFNIKGTTYEIRGMTASGRKMEVVKSDKTVAEILPPPDLGVGKPVLAFEGKSTDGKAVKFPGDYKGKLVMVDFWATWCGPCVAEIPNVVKAYEEFHGKGFEVLGISLDNADAAQKLKDFTAEKGMKWPQIYDGKGWKAAIADLYAVDGIPFVLLVDGDTGKVVATEADLRGAKLLETVKRELEKKAGVAN